MSRRVLSLLSLVALLSALPGILQAHSETSPDVGVALVYVALQTHDDLVRFHRTGLPAYARLYGRAGSYGLTGVDPTDLAVLEAAGLSIRVLDADTAGGNYYLNYPTPGQARLDPTAHGRLILDDGVQALWRLSPQDVEWLTETGSELSALTLVPKPLRPAFVPGTIPAVVEPDPLIRSMIDQVSSSTVRQYVGDLSGEWPVDIGGTSYTISTRYTCSGIPMRNATQYVGEHLEALGLDVEYHVWEGVAYPNVIGEMPGEINPEDIYIICAHLDDAPFGPVAPGADDNASGSAAVLIAADILSQYRWGSTLRFVLFTGEEQWSMEESYAHGSYPYVQRAHSNAEHIVGVLNLDMLGWDSERNPAPDIDLQAKSSPTLSPTLELAQLFADVVDTYDLNLIPQISPNGSGLGDHGSFWDHGYIAIMGIEDLLDFNPFYHTQMDQLGTLDLAYLTEFVKASVGTFAHMSGSLIPTRIGCLVGHVTTATDGVPLVGATVTAHNELGYSFSATTGGAGYYTRTLLAGTYTVTASADSYFTSTIGGITVLTDTVTQRDFALEPSPAFIVYLPLVLRNTNTEPPLFHHPDHFHQQRRCSGRPVRCSGQGQ